MTHFPTARTRGFIQLASLLALAVETLLRVRILQQIAFPSNEPILWFLVGLCEDVLVVGIAAALWLALARWERSDRATRVTFAMLMIVFSLGNVIVSEAVIFLGAAVTPEDFRSDVAWDVVRRTMTQPLSLLILGTSIVIIVALETASANERLRRWTWLTAKRALVAAVIAGALLPLLDKTHRIRTARNSVVALAKIGREQAATGFGWRFDYPKPALPVTAVRELLPREPARRFTSNDYPLASVPVDESQPIVPPGVKPNIVILALESMRAEEIGCYGADPPNVTPNLDALARNGIRVDDVYSASTYTATSEVAIQYGLLPIPKEFILSSRPWLPLTGLPEVLRGAGWKEAVWMHNGDYNFYRRDLFYRRRGYTIVDGHQFPIDAPATNWGYSDRALAKVAVEVLDRARPPFFSFVLTVTNHHPFNLPPDAGPRVPLPETPQVAGASPRVYRERTAPLIQTMHYTDSAIGDFFRLARKRPWFKNTIFVITGDHGVAYPPLMRPVTSFFSLDALRHRVPLIFYSPLIAGGQTIAGPASHVDIMPTLLGMTGVRLPRGGFGIDLRAPHRSPDRAVLMWSAHSRTFSIISRKRIYTASFLSEQTLEHQTPNEQLFDRIADPEGTHDISARQPQEMAHYRRLRDIYTKVYPWMLTTGHGTVVPGSFPYAISRGQRD